VTACVPNTLHLIQLSIVGGNSGTEIKVEGQDYLILREDEIIGILSKIGQAAGKK
jgi:co-chaperonin GroES (HSP10)